ncbi:MAG: hypothetical protein AAF125_18250, partial [Chloroflexota bacterium]
MRVGRIALGVLVALLPLAIAVGALLAATGTYPWMLYPVLSDEVLYWHQAATFRVVGFNGGYYTDYELTAPASFSNYYAWGPFIPMVYGLAGRLMGWWGLSALVMVNLAVFTLVWAGVLAAHRPRAGVLGLLALVLLTFPPYLMLSARSLTEVLHQAIGVGLAGGFYGVLTAAPGRAKWRATGLLAIAILAVSMLR